MLKGIEIVISNHKDEEYVSLTDMAKYKNYDSGVVISNWLTTKYSLQFIGAWEKLHNPIFNLMEFHKIKNEVDPCPSHIKKTEMTTWPRLRRITLPATFLTRICH